MSFSKVYSRLPRFAQVLVEDTQRLNEYPRFMRLAMTFGTIIFLYKFGQTMQYLDSEKVVETPELRAKRRAQEKELRDQLTQEALSASRIKPVSDEHIRRVIEKVNNSR
jgi:hypothetical protein